MNNINQYITTNKDIAAGVPVFKGTRVAVKTLFDYLKEDSLEEFLKGFPSVSREQAEATIELTAESDLNKVFGIWENKNITLDSIRKEAWQRKK